MADEYVYAHAFSDCGPDFAVKYRIVKRTRTRLYVENHFRPRRTEGKPRCFMLDREAFERDGEVYCPSRGETYYATEARALEMR